jgi:hypothetical protein
MSAPTMPQIQSQMQQMSLQMSHMQTMHDTPSMHVLKRRLSDNSLDAKGIPIGDETDFDLQMEMENHPSHFVDHGAFVPSYLVGDGSGFH